MAERSRLWFRSIQAVCMTLRTGSAARSTGLLATGGRPKPIPRPNCCKSVCGPTVIGNLAQFVTLMTQIYLTAAGPFRYSLTLQMEPQLARFTQPPGAIGPAAGLCSSR